MKTTLRNNFHSMSIKCVFENKASITLQLGYGSTGGRGAGVTQAAFDGVMSAFDRLYQGFDEKRFANNGEFMKGLNEFLASQAIADPVTLAYKIDEFNTVAA